MHISFFIEVAFWYLGPNKVELPVKEGTIMHKHLKGHICILSQSTGSGFWPFHCLYANFNFLAQRCLICKEGGLYLAWMITCLVIWLSYLNLSYIICIISYSLRSLKSISDVRIHRFFSPFHERLLAFSLASDFSIQSPR